jgi:acetyl-CoA synthetase (ADP-forming)
VVFEAVCAARGVVLMRDALDLLAAAETVIRQGRMRTDGIAVFSVSGGSGALWTDTVHESGLRLGRLAAETRSRLGELLPATHCDLPIDLGMVGQSPLPHGTAIDRIVSTVMADPDIGAGLYVMTTQPDTVGAANTIAAIGERCGKPLLFINVAGSSGEAARCLLRERHFLSFDTPDEALRTLGALATDFALQRAHDARRREPARVPVAPPSDTRDLPPGPLTETEAKSLLARFGIPVTRERIAATAREAIAHAGRIGYPVVLKGSTRGLIHKSDLGAVRLGLSDAAGVESAFNEIRDTLARAGYGPERFDGCLVQ